MGNKTDFSVHPPLVSFYFQVDIEDVGNVSFSEVSGLTIEFETAKIKEGGGFGYEVPVGIKHGRMTCKRENGKSGV